MRQGTREQGNQGFDSLRRLLGADFPERGEVAERVRGREGVLTTSVRGSHVHITARLFGWPRRVWEALMRWTPRQRDFDRIAVGAKFFQDALVVAVVGAGLFIAIEVGAAFLPGGAVDQALKAVR